MSHLHAKGFRVLLRIPKLREVTAGGIILSQQTVNANTTASEIGVFVNKGELADSDYKDKGVEFPIKEGDYVYFDRYTGTYTKDRDGTEYRFVWSSDIVGVADAKYVETHYDVDGK